MTSNGNFFKAWFSFSNKDDIMGPSELPSDIENDLRNRRPDFEVPGSWTNKNENEFEREFYKMFGGFDYIFRGFFNGAPSIGNKFGGMNEVPKQSESNYESSDSLRERMLGGNREDKISNILNRQPNDPTDERMPGFCDPDTMFRKFFNIPFQFEENPIPQEDRDLDDEVKSGRKSIADIFEKTDTENSRNSIFFGPFSWDGFNDNEPDKKKYGGFKFSSITKKYNSDGSIEIRSSKRDSDGSEETTVTRSFGDQSHTVVNKTNRDGERETKENFINLDEGSSDNMLIPNDTVGSLYDKFSSWRKPKL